MIWYCRINGFMPDRNNETVVKGVLICQKGVEMLCIYIADLMGLEDFYDEKVNMLHQARADKLQAYKMLADRIRGLGAGLLLENGLKDYLKTDLPKDALGRPVIEYTYGIHGKPYLKDYPEIFFSLSHSGTMAALALSDGEIGIDIQESRGYSEKIAKRFYHKDEFAMLQAVKEENGREKLFYQIWTGKEAYIKYTGTGMGQDLQHFYVNIAKEAICSEGQTVAYYKNILLDKNGYFCSLVFDKNSQKIDKIVKMQL